MLLHSLICAALIFTTSFGFIFEDFASQTVFCECGPVPPEKQPNCDITTTCQHGTWTTVKQFDMTFGFCDCELGWYGEFCELSSSLFEHPDLVCFLNFGKWNGCACTCSAGNFGRFCQFQLFNIQKRRKKCPCETENDILNLSTYVCDSNANRPSPETIPQPKEMSAKESKSLPYPKFEPKDIATDINNLPYSYSKWNMERRQRPNGFGTEGAGVYPNVPNWQSNLESSNQGQGKGSETALQVPNSNWYAGQVDNSKISIDNQPLLPNVNTVPSWVEQENMKKHNTLVQSIAQPHPQQQLLPPPQHQWFPHPQPPPHPSDNKPRSNEHPKIAIEVHVSPPLWPSHLLPSAKEESKNTKDQSTDNNSIQPSPNGQQQSGQDNKSNKDNAAQGANQSNSNVITGQPIEGQDGKEESNKNQNGSQPPNYWQPNPEETQQQLGAVLPPFLSNRWQPNFESKNTIDVQITEPVTKNWQSLNSQRTTTTREVFVAPPFTTPPPVWQTVEDPNTVKDNRNSLPFVPFWQPKEDSKKSKFAQENTPSDNSLGSGTSGSTETNDILGSNSNSRITNRRKEPREEVTNSKNPVVEENSLFETYMSKWASDRLSIIGHVVIFILIFMGIILFLCRRFICPNKATNKGGKRQLGCPCRPCPCQIDRATPSGPVDRKPSDRSSFTDRLQEWNHMDRPVVERMSERERKYFDQIAERNLIDRLARGSRNSSTRSSTNFLLKPDRDRRIDRSTTSLFY